MISAFTTGLQEHQAQQQEAQGRQAFGQAMASFDPTTGTFKDPNALATIAMLDPQQAATMSANMYNAAQQMAMEKQREQFTMDQPHTPAQWVEYGAQHGKYGDLSIPENQAKYQADRQAAVSTGIKETAGAAAAQLSAQDFTNNVESIKAEINKGTMTGPLAYPKSNIARWGPGGVAYRQIDAGLEALRGQMLQAGKSPGEIADTIQRLTPTYTDDAAGLSDKVDGIKRELETYGTALPSTPPANRGSSTAAPSQPEGPAGNLGRAGPNDHEGDTGTDPETGKKGVVRNGWWMPQ